MDRKPKGAKIKRRVLYQSETEFFIGSVLSLTNFKEIVIINL
jgi:hypothetical protein